MRSVLIAIVTAAIVGGAAALLVCERAGVFDLPRAGEEAPVAAEVDTLTAVEVLESSE